MFKTFKDKVHLDHRARIDHCLGHQQRSLIPPILRALLTNVCSLQQSYRVYSAVHRALNMSQAMKRNASVARSIMSRLNQSKSCCPHHSGGGSGTVCISRPNSGASDKLGDYAFEMINSTLRFGKGVTAEIGYDVQNFGAKKPLIITDPNIAKTRAFKEVANSLTKLGIQFEVFTDVRCEPSIDSMTSAVEFARAKEYDLFVAVGGGSVIDTTKAASLLANNRSAGFLDFVPAPFGQGQIPPKPMKPLIAVPTTAGTGSETTGVSIFDLPEKKSKAGFRLRSIKPTLAIVDPLNMLTMPRNVAIYSGFDVLCHALESFTATPYYKRTPRPARPDLRPVYQGSNPVSDVWAREALKIINKYFRRSIFDPNDVEARSEMTFASSFAGMGFGNAGIHLCHGLSYPISSQGKKYIDKDYGQDHALIPHGLSVVTTAPADFIFTAPTDPAKHLEAANLLGANLPENASIDQIGNGLADVLRGFLKDFGCPNGLSAMGFDRGSVDSLAGAAMGFINTSKLAPRESDLDAVSAIYEKSLKAY
uniref:hydroxyacid-oxoacid transhydrogenase n=1 Tax=Panagrellus redivivus TaxID=6233 RepID=A0A7E4W154_PANRE